jgi:site-specific DNA-methyltransferase (adenine-specific)
LRLRVNIGKMKNDFHPACLVFPSLSGREFETLAEDIRRNGLLNPIVTLNGQILDGRNRFEACKMVGVAPHFVEWDGTGSPLDWVVATNLVRRHLSASQRAAIAFELLPMLEEEAKDRQRQSLGRGKKVAKELATFPGKASQIAARITNANSAYVETVKSIHRRVPELIPHIKSGRMTVAEARRLTQVNSEDRQLILALAHVRTEDTIRRLTRKVLFDRAKIAEASPRRRSSEISIWCGDCLELMRSRLEDGSIAVVTTSPPYNRGVPYRSYNDSKDEDEYLGWLAEVFVEINRVLEPDGSFFLVIGHAPKKPWTAMRVAEIAGKQFQLQNQIVWVKSISVEGQSRGHFQPINGARFLNRAWESIFHFTKTGDVSLDRMAIGVEYEQPQNAERTGKFQRCAGDVWFIPYPTICGKEDRGNHPATFPVEVAERCIKLAGIRPGMKVLDPFCGIYGMIAAARLGVDGIGIDIDPEYCEIAKKVSIPQPSVMPTAPGNHVLREGTASAF